MSILSGKGKLYQQLGEEQRKLTVMDKSNDADRQRLDARISQLERDIQDGHSREARLEAELDHLKGQAIISQKELVRSQNDLTSKSAEVTFLATQLKDGGRKLSAALATATNARNTSISTMLRYLRAPEQGAGTASNMADQIAAILEGAIADDQKPLTFLEEVLLPAMCEAVAVSTFIVSGLIVV